MGEWAGDALKPKRFIVRSKKTRCPGGVFSFWARSIAGTGRHDSYLKNRPTALAA
jgi:hypothetical protein